MYFLCLPVSNGVVNPELTQGRAPAVRHNEHRSLEVVLDTALIQQAEFSAIALAAPQLPLDLLRELSADELAREMNGRALEDVYDLKDPAKLLAAKGKQVRCT